MRLTSLIDLIIINYSTFISSLYLCIENNIQLPIYNDSIDKYFL